MLDIARYETSGVVLQESERMGEWFVQDFQQYIFRTALFPNSFFDTLIQGLVNKKVLGLLFLWGFVSNYWLAKNNDG